jgi:hypothetical protein
MVNWGDPRLPDSFWDKTIPEPNSGCWLWTASSDKSGYGHLNTKASRTRAPHRYAHDVLIGLIPDEMFSEHLCKTKCCVNPMHLRFVPKCQNFQFKGEEGKRYGSLTVVERTLVDGNKARWRCRCDCGGEAICEGGKLRGGQTRSCGCRLAIKHGMTGTPTHGSWTAMLARCRNPNAAEYSNYGGRGISVCSRWQGRYGFVNFLADLGERPEGTTIDRVDVNGNYEPGNCRWATDEMQRANRRCDPRFVSARIDELTTNIMTGDVPLTAAALLDAVEELRLALVGVRK